MWVKQSVREETGRATYVVSSAKTGAWAVFDPLWDVDPYFTTAATVT